MSRSNVGIGAHGVDVLHSLVCRNQGYVVKTRATNGCKLSKRGSQRPRDGRHSMPGIPKLITRTHKIIYENDWYRVGFRQPCRLIGAYDAFLRKAQDLAGFTRENEPAVGFIGGFAGNIRDEGSIAERSPCRLDH